MRTLVAVAVACLSVVGLTRADEVKASIKKAINIPAQGLGPALLTLSKERDIHVVLVSEDVSQLRTQGASGELSVDEALQELLEGTGLTFEYLDRETVSILPLATAPAVKPQSVGEEAEGVQRKSGFWERLRLAEADAAASTVKEESREVLSEIVVTAQKREERLQDVPISISVLTPNEIDRRRLVSSADYLRGMPGVNQVEAGLGGQAIVIRGLTTELGLQNTGSGPMAATYFGETPTTTSAGFTGSSVDIKLVDIERVEVLRGPQGTAFGSSAMSGVVRTIPVAPKLDRMEASATAGYSVTSGSGGDNYELRAVLNVPLVTDRVAVRALGYRYEESGFYRNVSGSDAAFQAALVTPPGLDGIGIPAGEPYFPGGAYSLGSFAVDEDETGAAVFTGGRVSALFQASETLRFTLSFLTQKNEDLGNGISNQAGAYTHTGLQVAPEHVKHGHRGGFNNTDIDLLNGLMEYDLGWGDLLATYSHIKSQTENVFSWSTSIFPGPISSDYLNPHREDNGEIRVTTKADGAWNGIVGLYAERRNDEIDPSIVWYGDPATNFFAPLARELGGNHTKTQVQQRAAFGEVSWKLRPNLKLTGGLRAYEYDRDLDAFGEGPAFFAERVQNSAKESGTTYRTNISYQPSENAMLYAGWSQGFRLGLPQQGVPPSSCDANGDGVIDGTSISIESTKTVNSDEVDNYELGGKFTGLGNRLTLDATVYQMQWVGLPVSTKSGTPTCQLFPYSSNGGDARSTGVELQANWQVSRALRVDIGGSYSHARFTEAVPAIGVVSGTKLPGAPAVNGNLGVQYELQIGNLSPSIRADAIYVGHFRNFVDQAATPVVGGYTKVDLSARVSIGATKLDLFVRNATNQDEFTLGSLNSPLIGFRLRPRTIGVQISHDF